MPRCRSSSPKTPWPLSNGPNNICKCLAAHHIRTPFYRKCTAVPTWPVSTSAFGKASGRNNCRPDSSAACPCPNRRRRTTNPSNSSPASHPRTIRRHRPNIRRITRSPRPTHCRRPNRRRRRPPPAKRSHSSRRRRNRRRLCNSRRRRTSNTIRPPLSCARNTLNASVPIKYRSNIQRPAVRRTRFSAIYGIWTNPKSMCSAP